MAFGYSNGPSRRLSDEIDGLSINDNFKYLREHRNGFLNIVVIGKTGEGKSATINTVISHAKDPKPAFFEEAESPYSITKAFNQCTINVHGINCRLIDTIGLFDTEMTPERKAELQFLKIPDLEEEHKSVLKNLADVITLCSDGIDAFLLVVDGTARMTFETKETINVIQRFLGVAMLDHCIFVLTKIDRAENGIRTLQQTEEAITRYLNGINYSEIDNRFVHFDNKQRPKQHVTNLLSKIEENLQKRNGHPYTHIAFQQAQKVLAEEKQRLRTELEAELQRHIAAVTEQIRAEYDRKMKIIQDQMDEKARQIAALQENAVEERKKFEGEINGLNNEMIAMEKRKKKDIDSAVQDATAKCNEAYMERFRQMENSFQEQNRLLTESNQTVQELQKQVVELAKRPTVVHNHHHHKGGGCFAGDCIVDTDKGKKEMRNLKIGDLVLSVTDSGQFEYVPMLMWMQADAHDSMEFLEIGTRDGNVLSITKNHKLFKYTEQDSDKVTDVDADEILQGDLLCKFMNNSIVPNEVVKVAAEEKMGIYAPFTSSGKIVVDGILCSCYARITTGYVLYSHKTAHSICAPMRWCLSMGMQNRAVTLLAKSYLFGWISFNRILTKVSSVKNKLQFETL